MFLCPRSCLRIWSRETGSAVASRVSLLISILRLNLVLTYGIPPEFRGGVHLLIYNRHAPSGQSRVYRVTRFAYRWRSLPKVLRHGASKPQGSSERVVPWQVTMDQLIFASLSHTHYWYEVGMLKVPAVYILQCLMFCYVWWRCMAINRSVQYYGGFLPDITLLTHGYYHRGTCLNKMWGEMGRSLVTTGRMVMMRSIGYK